MEIVSYVLEGALEHRDSLGNGSIILPGEIQRMSAGLGITHSEFNPSREGVVHFLQIWITPEQTGLSPSYQQQAIDRSATRGNFHVIASRSGGPGKLKIHQNATISVANLQSRETLTHRLRPESHAWLQVARGAIRFQNETLIAGDGAAIEAEPQFTIQADEAAELLLFDLS
jgi:redox-sensitive bicupin YhaK (pirin superfamily)